MPTKKKVAPEVETAQEAEMSTPPEAEAESDAPDSVSLEAAGEASDGEASDGEASDGEASDGEASDDDAASEDTKPRRRPMTPEQHERKILRDRARRAMKSQEKAAAAGKRSASGKPAPIDESLTQEERDRPYRQRLSAMIQAADAARFNRVMDSQRRRAESKEKSASR